MNKFLLLFLLGFYSSTAVFGQLPTVKNSDDATISQSEKKQFNQLIAKFNILIETKSKKDALSYLANAENLLTKCKDEDLKYVQSTLALAFARAGNAAKAKLYQQLASAKSRGDKKVISLENLNKLALSFTLLNDTNGLTLFFEKAIETVPKTAKKPLEIAYVNSLIAMNENAKASTLLSELYTDTPLSTTERSDILSLLIINSLKLNQLQLVNRYFIALEKLKPKQTPNYFLAKGMYFDYQNQYANAIKNYQPLLNGFKNGKRELVYLDGVLQLAQLNSKLLKKDVANFYFDILVKAIQKPIKSTAIGIRYLKLYTAHQLRFNKATPDLEQTIKTRDSFFRNELITVTKELSYKHKIEEDKQRVELLNKNRAIDRQRSLLIIGGLAFLLLGGGAIIYMLYQKRKQGNLLHLAELERLKQFHKTEVIKKLSVSQEAERWRIADQLHDEVGSMISVVRLNLSSNPLKKERISEDKLTTANRILADLAATVREMSHELMPVAIRQYGLINAIEQLINDINTSGKIYIEHLIYGFNDLSKYPEDFQVSFYRIVQELFQNIVKHSKATNAIFQLMEHPDSINLYIEDNGKGMEKSKTDKTGKGISILATRIDYYEGKISIEGQPGKGTLIVIDIPTAHMFKENEKTKD